jgi:hypothetical protein
MWALKYRIYSIAYINRRSTSVINSSVLRFTKTKVTQLPYSKRTDTTEVAIKLKATFAIESSGKR